MKCIPSVESSVPLLVFFLNIYIGMRHYCVTSLSLSIAPHTSVYSPPRTAAGRGTSFWTLKCLPLLYWVYFQAVESRRVQDGKRKYIFIRKVLHLYYLDTFVSCYWIYNYNFTFQDLLVVGMMILNVMLMCNVLYLFRLPTQTEVNM